MPPARRLLAVLLFVPWLAACAPFLAPAGPEPGEAELVELPLGQLRLKTADGYRLLMRSWLPEEEAPRAVILALHGFNDHSTFIEDAAERWAEAGIATYAYDQRGFGTAPNRGLWAGAAAYTGDAADALRLLAERHGVPVFLLGESMGGAVAIATLTRHPDLPVAGAILAAPAVWSRETMPFYQRMGLLMASYTVPWFPLTASGLDIQASDNIQALRELGRDPLVIKETRVDAVHGLADLMDEAMAAAAGFDSASLLLYGAKDELVPEGPMLHLWRRLPETARERQRQAFYRDGWHLLFRDLSAERVIGDVAAWIADPAGPLPSGADRDATERLAAATADTAAAD